MDKISIDAVIVRVTHTGESDRIVWLLSADRGIVHAFAKGAQKIKGKLHSSTSLFCYGTFWLTESRGSYNITDAEIKEMFFPLREDLTAMTLGQYFCEASVRCGEEGTHTKEHLRLLLNSLHFLSSKKKAPLYIKSVYEMRLACILGYSPDIVMCRKCGAYETPFMFFDCTDGTICCEKCGNPAVLPKVPLSVIYAIRYIVLSDFEKIFSFNYENTDLEALNRLTEIYFLNSVQTEFASLDFFHNL